MSARSWFIFRRGDEKKVVEYHHGLAQHLADTTPPSKGENPIRAAFVCTLVLVGIVVAGWLVGKGCL